MSSGEQNICSFEIDDSAESRSSPEYEAVYKNDDLASVTTTLATSMKQYRYENGRRYHSYKEGEWIVPNDETQQDQMDLFHEVYSQAMGGKLFLAPIEGNDTRRVLDLGTGTGIWCMQFADKHPHTAVTGNDLSPIQPEWVPPNCTFEVDDFNETWNHPPDTYDYVHARALHGAVSSWPKFLSNAFRVTKPGGWIEVMCENAEFISDDDSLPSDSVIPSFLKEFEEAMESIGKTCEVAPHIENWILNAGFDESTIVHRELKIPIGTWPKRRSDKHMGAMNLVNMLMGIGEIAIITQWLQM